MAAGMESPIPPHATQARRRDRLATADLRLLVVPAATSGESGGVSTALRPLAELG